MKNLDVLLPEIADGNARAFAVWMSEAEPVLRRSLASFARSVDVESVVQEALLRTWNYAPELQVRGDNSLLRFALRAGRNLAISQTRRLRTTPVDPATLTEEMAPAMPDPHLRTAVQTCREQLPAKPARALQERLRAGGRKPDAEAAARAGMTKNTFLQNIARARRQLAECLKRARINVAQELSL